MYDNMSVLAPLTPVVNRGVALHKMIRLLTLVRPHPRLPAIPCLSSVPLWFSWHVH